MATSDDIELSEDQFKEFYENYGTGCPNSERNARTKRGSVAIWAIIVLVVGIFAIASVVAISIFRRASIPVTQNNSGLKTITISMTDNVMISPLIYGVNYEWNLIPAADFSWWAKSMNSSMHYSLVRYPSGWNAEHYQWGQNQEEAWGTGSGNCYDPSGRSCANKAPGAAPEVVLATSPAMSIVVPSGVYDKSGLQKDLDAIVVEARSLVVQYGSQVRIWEIGNEWWNQGDAHKSPADRAAIMTKYAKLVAAVAPAMKAVDPSIKIYATIDWQTPQDVTVLRQDVGAQAWQSIYGISIHAYCGDKAAAKASKNQGDTSCADLPSISSQIRSLSGKTSIYDSEWAATASRSTEDYGIRNATITLFTIQDIVRAGIDAATYWPGTDYVQPIALVMGADQQYSPTATGILFGWLSKYYEGEALQTGGNTPSIAAKTSDGSMTVLVPSMQNGPEQVQLSLAGTGFSNVRSAEVLYVDDFSAKSPSPHTTSLSVPIEQTQQGPVADFVLNPGGPNRGSGWEIARITFAP